MLVEEFLKFPFFLLLVSLRFSSLCYRVAVGSSSVGWGGGLTGWLPWSSQLHWWWKCVATVDNVRVFVFVVAIIVTVTVTVVIGITVGLVESCCAIETIMVIGDGRVREGMFGRKDC